MTMLRYEIEQQLAVDLFLANDWTRQADKQKTGHLHL